MRHYLTAAIIVFSTTATPVFAGDLAETGEPVAHVAIENYQFEFQQTGAGKFENSLTEGISFNSVVLSYTLRQNDIVESATLLASLSKTAEDKCTEVAGTREGKIISKTRAVSSSLISGKFICSIK